MSAQTKFLTIGGILLLLCGLAFVYLHTPAKPVSWEEKIKVEGGAAAYAEFSRSVKSFSYSEQHVQAHVFGKSLYAVLGEEGIAVCDDKFNYGCAHQLIASSIAANGLTSVASTSAYCLTVKIPDLCAHALGHGILAYVGYTQSDLEKGMPVCDRLLKSSSGACFVGLFMEYNYRTMLEGPPRPASDDHYSPCNAIPKEYASRCYYNQPDWWRSTLYRDTDSDQSFTKMGVLCRGISDAESVNECFRGMGWVSYFSSKSNVATALRLCADAGGHNQQQEDICRNVVINTDRIEGVSESL